MIGYSKYKNQTQYQTSPTKIKQIREFDNLQQNYQILFFCFEGSGEYISCYDDSFDEDCIYTPILDFRNRQPFYSFELQDNKKTKTYHESVRVRFEIEK